MTIGRFYTSVTGITPLSLVYIVEWKYLEKIYRNNHTSLMGESMEPCNPLKAFINYERVFYFKTNFSKNSCEDYGLLKILTNYWKKVRAHRSRQEFYYFYFGWETRIHFTGSVHTYLIFSIEFPISGMERSLCSPTLAEAIARMSQFCLFGIRSN